MWDANGRLKDVKAVMPESTFARIYQEMINFCKWHGAFDPKTMGTVPNVGLMAQQAEEYGSPTRPSDPRRRRGHHPDLATGEVLLSQNVEQGDIWRMCQVKDAAIRDWVKLAVNRARNSGMPVVFWLDSYRPHEGAADHQGEDVPARAQHHRPRYPDHEPGACDALHAGARDPWPGHHQRHRQHPARLPDRPVPHHGTGHLGQDAVHRAFDGWRRYVRNRCGRLGPSMCSNWWKKTTCAGTAWVNSWPWPCRWKTSASRPATPGAKVLAKTLDAATGKLLDNNKNPSPKTGQLDNRGSQFYLALYWAQELAAQTEDAELAAKFAPLAKQLAADEQKIVRRAERRARQACRYRRLLPARYGQAGRDHAPQPDVQQRTEGRAGLTISWHVEGLRALNVEFSA